MSYRTDRVNASETKTYADSLFVSISVSLLFHEGYNAYERMRL